MIKKRVRIGSVEQQDQWRRDDIEKLVPSERLDLLNQMRAQYTPSVLGPIKRVAKIHHRAQ